VDSLPGIQGKVPPLLGTATELQALGKIVQGRYMLASEASESAFKLFASQFGILHLALHARADADPQILFPRGGAADEDGILHFHELFQMRLKSRMAVLSACETAVGQLQQGEGVQSMSSGFAAAGIPTLLVSLWEVDDKSGATIMNLFYQGLRQGLPVDEALRKAKLSYLENATGYEASPFFWSTFVPLGNMEPLMLQPAHGNYGNSIVVGLTMVLCIFAIFRIYKKKRKSTRVIT
jgi:CHAT domain-containing protein